MFYNCTNLTSVPQQLNKPNNGTTFSYMFGDCVGLTSLDVSNFNTSKVTDMSGMLSYVPITLDWQYNGANYQNWTLTELDTDYSGTFPWNQ